MGNTFPVAIFTQTAMNYQLMAIFSAKINYAAKATKEIYQWITAVSTRVC
jgi:hypothetical protein